MSINGIGTGYQATGYETRKTEKNVTKENFADQAVKAAEIKTIRENAMQEKMDYGEKSFESIAPNAPEKVKQAWMEAAKEVGVDGLGTKKNGMLSHISQMMVERLERSWNGKGNSNDILGSTVASAIRATKQALYDLEHPLAYTPRSMEVQQARMKEGDFYRAFIAKLELL